MLITVGRIKNVAQKKPARDMYRGLAFECSVVTGLHRFRTRESET